MKILVVGGGGREHALAWKLVNDPGKPRVYCAPGNAGTAQIAENVAIGAEDVATLTEWARKELPDLTVVGPEVPLCAGLTDRFAREGLRVFGPSQAAAQLEGSKFFSKEVMEAAGVPTAAARGFADVEEAIQYVRAQNGPLVVKAEGLAAGKGVFVCASAAEAEQAVRTAMVEKAFGEAGGRVLIEEMLEGEEASLLALVDGETVVLLASSQDHKRIFDGDQGPNTGGMGAYSPAPVVTEDLWPQLREAVFSRTLDELRRRGIVYKGVLYAGIMMTRSGPKVLEFNCRFGDPETQAVLPRMDCAFVDVLNACVDGTLRPEAIRWRPDPCVCVVMAAGGYPGSYAKGAPIEGLDEAGRLADVVVFHAGTQRRDGKVVTAGGRVLGVTALGRDLKAAVAQAYRAASMICFDGAQFRRDIAARALARTGEAR